MRWLLTTRTDVDSVDLERELAPIGVSVIDVPPTPLGDELVFQAEGPRDLPARLEGKTTRVLGAYPDSEAEPYL